jgi:hypothetical protein
VVQSIAESDTEQLDSERKDTSERYTDTQRRAPSKPEQNKNSGVINGLDLSALMGN